MVMGGRFRIILVLTGTARLLRGFVTGGRTGESRKESVETIIILW